MLTLEQIEARRQGIGGTDAAALIGLSKYKQAFDIFCEKRPDIAAEIGYAEPVVEGDAVDFGTYVEEPIAQLYAKRTGNRVRKMHKSIVHKKAPWMRANIDRRIVGQKRGLEIKSANWRVARDWGETGTDEVAEYYIPQVVHYMCVLGWDHWDVAALIGGATDFRIYHLELDSEWKDIVTDAERDFWTNHVVPGIPPDIDPEHQTSERLLKRLYNQVSDEQIQLPPEALHWHNVLQESKRLEKQYGDAVTLAGNHLKRLIGNAGRAYVPGINGAYVRSIRKRKACEVPACEYINLDFKVKR